MVEVPLEKGVPDEHDYVFYGESDEIVRPLIFIIYKPGAMAGDLYLRVKIEKHKLYERKGADLYTKKKISLVEALTGTSFSLKFLDDTTLFISTPPGEVISPCIRRKSYFSKFNLRQSKVKVCLSTRTQCHTAICTFNSKLISRSLAL